MLVAEYLEYVAELREISGNEARAAVADAVEVRVWVRYLSGMGRARSVEVVTVIYVGV